MKVLVFASDEEGVVDWAEGVEMLQRIFGPPAGERKKLEPKKELPSGEITRRVLDVLLEREIPVSAPDIAEATGLKFDQVRNCLNRLVMRGDERVEKAYGGAWVMPRRWREKMKA